MARIHPRRPPAAMLGGSPASAYVKADARGLAVACATVKANGTLSSWFNRAGGATTVSGGGDGNGHYYVEFPGVSVSTATHVATADIIGLAGLVTVDYTSGKPRMRTWDADAATDAFDNSDRSYTVLVHASGASG